MKQIKTHFGAQTLILSFALLLALPVRVYQYLHVIDGTSGFYNNWFNPTVFGLYGLCLLVIILLVVLSAKSGKQTIYAMPSGKKIGLGLSALASSLAFLAASAFNAVNAYGILSGSRVTEQLVLGNNVGKSTLLFTAIQVLFGVLSAVFMLAYAVSCFSGKEQYKKVKILAASPALWAVARLMLGFSQTISFRYVSELLFDLLTALFIAMFFVAFAKFSVGALTARVQMRLFGYGMLSIFFCLLSAVPRYIMLLMGRSDVLYRSMNAYEAADLILPIFVACFIFAVAATKQYKAVEEYGSSEEDAE